MSEWSWIKNMDGADWVMKSEATAKVRMAEAERDRLREAGKWVLYTTIHGIRMNGEEAGQTEKEEAIYALTTALNGGKAWYE